MWSLNTIRTLKSSNIFKHRGGISLQGEDHADERLAGVLNLYGVVPSAQAQYALLLKASEFARGSARTAKMLSSAVQGKADRWVREWGLPAAESGALYLSFALLFKVGRVLRTEGNRSRLGADDRFQACAHGLCFLMVTWSLWHLLGARTGATAEAQITNTLLSGLVLIREMHRRCGPDQRQGSHRIPACTHVHFNL